MKSSEWKVVKLEDVCYFGNDKIETKMISLEDYISTENMLPNKGGISIASSLPSTKVVRMYEKNDVLISNIRPYFKKIWFARKIGGASNDVLILKGRNKKILDNKFMYYYLSQDGFFSYVTATAKGTKMPRGDKTAIMNYKINLPTIQEQENIVRILTSLDKKIEINNEINKKLEELAQAIFKHWFVDFEFPNENGEPYKSSGGEMVESELGMIPKGWKIGSINDLGTIVSGGTPSKKKEEYYTEHGIPWITPKDLSLNKNRFISRGTIDITEEGLKNSRAKLMPKGTVLFSSRAPIGYIAIAKNEVSTNQGFKSIIPKNNIGSEFVYQFLKMNKEIIESRASGSTFKEISGGELKKIPAIIPSNNIIYRYNLITIKISSFIKNNEEELEKLRTIRDTLLPKLMSGEIRVPVEEEK
ncbi:restriction endonuclease subunit S [Caldibacillus thermoamylovorans]